MTGMDTGACGHLIGSGKRFFLLILVTALVVGPGAEAGGVETVREVPDCVEARFRPPPQTSPALRISVLVFHPDAEREIQITIDRKSHDGPLGVRVTEANGMSVEQQLSLLQEADSDANVDTLCSRIRIDQYDVNVDQEDLSALVGAFERLQISPLPPSTITIHGVQTSISASTWAGSFSYRYSGFGWSEPDRLPPLQGWVRNLFLTVLPSLQGERENKD